MNVPADNEHLQRFFMVLQSNAAAQNLQANIMAATLQSQATQIINNQILANQKAHHLHQVEQNYLKKKTKIFSDAPTKPEHAPISTTKENTKTSGVSSRRGPNHADGMLAASQKGLSHEKKTLFMIIFSLSSKPSTSPNIDPLQIIFR